MERALFRLGGRLYEAIDYIFNEFDDIRNIDKIRRAIIITVTANSDELVRIEELIRSKARAFNSKYVSLPGWAAAVNVSRSRKPRPGVPGPNERFTIQVVTNPVLNSGEYPPMYLVYNQITPRPQLRPPPPPVDPTIPLSNTQESSFGSFESSQAGPVGGNTQPMEPLQPGVLDPEGPPAFEQAAEFFRNPATPPPATPEEPPGTVIQDPYITHRRVWSRDEPPARGSTKIDDVVNVSDRDMLMENRVYVDYVVPIITAPEFEIPADPIIGAWIELAHHDRVYAGFIALRCIEHFLSTQKINEANAMGRVWLNAALGVYDERDLPHALAEVEGDIVRAGMTLVECEVEMLSLLSRMANAIYEAAYKSGMQAYMETHITEFIHAKDAAIYRRLIEAPDKLLQPAHVVNGILFQCMHEAAAHFFVDQANRAAPTARDIPLRLYLVLPPDFYDSPMFERNTEFETFKIHLRERIVAALGAPGRPTSDGYTRLLMADKMMRQNVEFSPIVQCTAPPPLYKHSTATGIVPADPVDEYGFPLPETVKWPLLNFRYVLNNGEHAVPHSSWHNSRLARALRWQAFTRMVDMVLGRAGPLRVYEWSSQLHMHDPTNYNTSRHGVEILPKYRYKSPRSKEGTTEDRETIITAVINMSYDRTLVSKGLSDEVRVGPGEMYIYERTEGGAGKLVAERRDNRENASDMNPFMYMQCSIIVVRGATRRPDSLTRFAVENGNILQMAGVFRSTMYRTAQSHTDHIEYVNFMYKPRSVIESPSIYPIFRDNRIMLQRAALYEWFNLPMIIAEGPAPSKPKFAIPYISQPTYSDKAYKGFDTQRILLDPRSEGVTEIIHNLSEAQKPSKVGDAMYVPTIGKYAFAAEMKQRNLEAKLLYPVYLPPTRSLFLMAGFNNEYDQSILRDLLSVSEYEIARMMGATRLNDAYIKRTPEAYETYLQAEKQN